MLDGFEAIVNSINYLSGVIFFTPVIISTKLLIYWPYLLKLKFEGFKKQNTKKYKNLQMKTTKKYKHIYS